MFRIRKVILSVAGASLIAGTCIPTVILTVITGVVILVVGAVVASSGVVIASGVKVILSGIVVVASGIIVVSITASVIIPLVVVVWSPIVVRVVGTSSAVGAGSASRGTSTASASGGGASGLIGVSIIGLCIVAVRAGCSGRTAGSARLSVAEIGGGQATGQVMGEVFLPDWCLFEGLETLTEGGDGFSFLSAQ